MLTPGPVGHVFGSILQLVKGDKNVCCLRTDVVYFGYVQIHSFVAEVP